MNVFLRHGILSTHDEMNRLATQFQDLPGNLRVNNQAYAWKSPVVDSGLELASQVLEATDAGPTVLVGHSQGGLVCRVAATALAGKRRSEGGTVSEKVCTWQQNNPDAFNLDNGLGVVTIATPNCGALALGQLSAKAELMIRIGENVAARTRCSLEDFSGLYNLKDLTTPRLFQELQNWRVRAHYLSVSGARVNRFGRNAWGYATDGLGVRLALPNDGIVEDVSTDLRHSLITPEVDLKDSYRHARSYPNAICLGHGEVRESPDVFAVIKDNLKWLCGQE